MRSILVLAAIMSFTLISAQTKRSVESKIEKVTVFLDGAQVERSSKIFLSPGKYELLFTNISPSVDKQSIQVKADPNITVLSVIHQQNFLKEQQKQAEIRELETQKEGQLDKIASQKNILNVFKQEEVMIIKNQEIGGANNGIKTADLKDAVDFQRNRLTEVYQKQMEIEKNIKKLEIDLTKINKQLIELNQKTDISTSEVHVTINVKESTTAGFILTYLVKQAGWYPTYDIRVKDIMSPIGLQYKANVFQKSGEDWKDVKMFLSTGNPNENGTKPSIAPWYLRYADYQAIRIRGTSTIEGTPDLGTISGIIRDEKGNPVPYATVTVKGATNAVMANASGFYNLSLPPGKNSIVISAAGYNSQEIFPITKIVNIALIPTNAILNEVVVTGFGINRDSEYSIDKPYRKKKEESPINTTITYKPTTTIYEIEDPYTVLNDGKTYTVEIDGYDVNALFEYYAAPKLEEDAFLTAKIVEWQDLNLLPGEANLFFEGTYLGKSILDVVNAGDTLKLSLGKDKGVVIKRTLLKEFSSKKFLGNNRTDIRQYEIIVKNNKQTPINIVVEDQFPITTQKDIEVQERKYDGGKLDDDTQKITWQLNIDAKKENKVNFRYEVKYPKDKILQLN